MRALPQVTRPGPGQTAAPAGAASSTPQVYAVPRRAAAWLWLGALVCPCHFPLIVLLALGGTAAGVAARQHVVWLYAGSATLFTAFLVAGLRAGRGTRAPWARQCPWR